MLIGLCSAVAWLRLLFHFSECQGHSKIKRNVVFLQATDLIFSYSPIMTIKNIDTTVYSVI